MARSILITLLGAAAATAEASPADALGLVQKSLTVSAVQSNATATSRAASEILVKMSGLVHMIDHDIANEEEPSKLEELFHCTRSAGVDTADGIIEVTNQIVEVRRSCTALNRRNGSGRRLCAKGITGFLGETLGLILILPQLPVKCFQQDCSAKDNWNHEVNPALAMGGGVETMLGMMTAIGNVDSTCVSRESRTIAAVQDANLQFPSWMSWAMKPFHLMSEAYDLSALAVSKNSESYHFAICGSVASFTGASLGLMESLFNVKANEEYKTLGDTSDSSSWACAASLTKLVKALPSVVEVACNYESCQTGEPTAIAKSLKPAVVG
mmetsp:Transcript_35562/g.80826  ORF Transcript_35562/g.80826 Transcript_35562/m.80826 type:complete len:326 (-) Transcript_35562:104-1081(-)